jgi:hypothetical protein
MFHRLYLLYVKYRNASSPLHVQTTTGVVVLLRYELLAERMKIDIAKLPKDHL